VVSELVVGLDDPRCAEVLEVLERHLAFSFATTEPEHVFALDLDGLTAPGVHFVSARRDGVVLGIGALKALDATNGELKSMHTIEEARGQGVAAAIVVHLMGVAADLGLERISLETGSQDAFAPARALYGALGFQPCGAFGSYEAIPSSAFLTRLV
jgi:putative acetyltransferase